MFANGANGKPTDTPTCAPNTTLICSDFAARVSDDVQSKHLHLKLQRDGWKFGERTHRGLNCKLWQDNVVVVIYVIASSYRTMNVWRDQCVCLMLCSPGDSIRLHFDRADGQPTGSFCWGFCWGRLSSIRDHYRMLTQPCMASFNLLLSDQCWAGRNGYMPYGFDVLCLASWRIITHIVKNNSRVAKKHSRVMTNDWVSVRGVFIQKRIQKESFQKIFIDLLWKSIRIELNQTRKINLKNRSKAFYSPLHLKMSTGPGLEFIYLLEEEKHLLTFS